MSGRSEEEGGACLGVSCRAGFVNAAEQNSRKCCMAG
jgi:hypothetical protein